jgi:hypothetical protein
LNFEVHAAKMSRQNARWWAPHIEYNFCRALILPFCRRVIRTVVEFAVVVVGVMRRDRVEVSCSAGGAPVPAAAAAADDGVEMAVTTAAVVELLEVVTAVPVT